MVAQRTAARLDTRTKRSQLQRLEEWSCRRTTAKWYGPWREFSILYTCNESHHHRSAAPTPVVEVYDAHLPSLRSVATFIDSVSERVCRRLPAYDAAMPVEKLLAQRNGQGDVFRHMHSPTISPRASDKFGNRKTKTDHLGYHTPPDESSSTGVETRCISGPAPPSFDQSENPCKRINFHVGSSPMTRPPRFFAHKENFQFCTHAMNHTTIAQRPPTPWSRSRMRSSSHL